MSGLPRTGTQVRLRQFFTLTIYVSGVHVLSQSDRWARVCLFLLRSFVAGEFHFGGTRFETLHRV